MPRWLVTQVEAIYCTFKISELGFQDANIVKGTGPINL